MATPETTVDKSGGKMQQTFTPKTSGSRGVGDSLQLSALLGDLRLLVIMFIAFRFMLLMIYEPIMVEDLERGVTAGGDFHYFRLLGRLSENGAVPYVDWWSEYPPLLTYIPVTIYSVLGPDPNYNAFSFAMGMVLLAADVGNLLLLRKIGMKLYGAATGMSLAWIYALLVAPVVMIWWNFEVLILFWAMLSLWWLVQGKDNRSAVAAALGGLTKFTPLLVLGTVWRFRKPRTALRYTLIALGIFVGVFVILYVRSPEMTYPSLIAQLNKASYQTVWALIDGNYTTGSFGAVDRHFDPNGASVLAPGLNPSVVPGWLRMAVAGLIGLFIFLRTRRFDEKGIVAFATITTIIFFLQAQGWSPQWIIQLIPLILLNFPNRNGVFVVLLLSLATFTEYPVLFMRTGDTGWHIEGALRTPFTIIIFMRTAMLVGLCIALYQRLRQEPVPDLTQTVN